MLVDVQVSQVGMVVVRHLGSVHHPSSHLTGDFALLQELLRVQRVECSQVVDHGHEFLKDCALVGMLRQQDAAQNHLQFVLHSLKQFRVPEAGTV